MPGVHGEKWAVSFDTEPYSGPVYFLVEDAARQSYESRPSAPGWHVRLHAWDSEKQIWRVIEHK